MIILKSDFKSPEFINLSLEELVSKVLIEVQEKENEIFFKAIMENAKPPIKGMVTKNKLKWRGIKMVHNQVGKRSKWIEQRGVRISPIIMYDESYGIK